MGRYHKVVYDLSLQVQVEIKSEQHAFLQVVHTGLLSTYFFKFSVILCVPLVDMHAVYFLLLPGPGWIIHKLFCGICPL